MNSSFAGVKDISIKCEDVPIFEDWKSSYYQDWLLGAFWDKETDPGRRYVSDVIIVGDSNSSVSIEFIAWIEHKGILEGKYKLTQEKPSRYVFSKKLRLNGKEGVADLVLNREDGDMYWHYELDVDKVWRSKDINDNYKDFPIVSYKANFYSYLAKGCKQYTRIF